MRAALQKQQAEIAFVEYAGLRHALCNGQGRRLARGHGGLPSMPIALGKGKREREREIYIYIYTYTHNKDGFIGRWMCTYM